MTDSNVNPADAVGKPLPPDWAIERALKRFPNPSYVDGKPWTVADIKVKNVTFTLAVRFMASQIEECEEPPIDPLVQIVRDIVADDLAARNYGSDFIQYWREGSYDREPPFAMTMTALKRGIEMGRDA